MRIWWAALPAAGAVLMALFLTKVPAPDKPASPSQVHSADAAGVTPGLESGVTSGSPDTGPQNVAAPQQSNTTPVAELITETAAAPSPQPSTSAMAPTPPARAQSSARDVGRGLIAAPLLQPGQPLERIAPEQEAAPAIEARPPASAEKEEKSFLLFGPVAINAGTITADGRTIQLSDILPVDAGRKCQRPDGSQWPCGMAARTALRQFLRGRAVACTLDDQQQRVVTASCKIGRQDIAEWLIEQGWAEAGASSPFGALSEASRAMGRGIHGRGG
jgi:hypothetical protein